MANFHYCASINADFFKWQQVSALVFCDGSYAQSEFPPVGVSQTKQQKGKT